MTDSSAQKVKETGVLEDRADELKFESQKEGALDSNNEALLSYAGDLYHLVAQDAKKFFGFLKTLKLEVIMFIYIFSYVLRSVSSTTMIIEKVCVVHLGYSEDLCHDLENNKTIKMEVEKMGNNYHLFHSLIQVVPSAFLGCFIGPWSDRYGRKVPIVIALIGIIIDGCGAIVSAAYMHTRVELYVMGGLFTGLSGGFVTVLSVVYSWASDTTTPENRTLKYTLLELAFGIGLPLGSLAGGLIYRYSGYVYVFATSVAGHFIGLLWVLFFIAETRGLDNKDPIKVKTKSFFTSTALMDSFRTVSKRRPNLARLQIWLLVLSICISFLANAAVSSTTYMFTYHQYNWDNTKYSTVFAIFSVTGLFIMLALVPLLTKIFRVGDAALGIIGSASTVAKNVATSFSKTENYYYLANLLGLLTGMASLAGRSRLSKIVPNNELGKVFTFVSTAETLLPVIGLAIFSQVFNVSLNFDFPGLVFLIVGLISVTSLLIFIWIGFLPSIAYDKLSEENTSREEKQVELVESAESNRIPVLIDDIRREESQFPRPM